jgi:hypothetical protein
MAPGHSGAIPRPPVLARARALALPTLVGCMVATGCGAGSGAGGSGSGYAPGGGTETAGSNPASAPRGGAGPVGSDPADTPRDGAGTARSGGLTATLVVAPAATRAGGVVTIELTARARHAPGAVGYLLRYGDGTGAGSGAAPQFCIAEPAPSAHRTWRLKHRYRIAGRYVVSASVFVNCTPDRATASAPVRVG